jgi:hypothetical protein
VSDFHQAKSPRREKVTLIPFTVHRVSEGRHFRGKLVFKIP